MIDAAMGKGDLVISLRGFQTRLQHGVSTSPIYIADGSSASTYLLWIQFRSIKKDISIESRMSLLKSIHQQFERHMQYWFPIDPGKHLKVYVEVAEDEASGSFSASEQIILKWFDLNHLLKILNQMLEICSQHEVPETQRAFIGVAGQFAGQTELLATSGHLTYLLDTSAAHISALGTMIHSVSNVQSSWLQQNAE